MRMELISNSQEEKFFLLHEKLRGWIMIHSEDNMNFIDLVCGFNSRGGSAG